MAKRSHVNLFSSYLKDTQVRCICGIWCGWLKGCFCLGSGMEEGLYVSSALLRNCLATEVLACSLQVTIVA